jgi:transposase
MRHYNIKDEYTKPYHPWQNPVERQMAPQKDRIARMLYHRM